MSSGLMEEEKTDVYAAPDVQVGDIVYWHYGADANRAGVPCMVEGKTPDSVELKGLTSAFWGIIKQGVRHVSDPRLVVNEEWRKNGAWDHTPTTKAHRALKRECERQASEIRHLLKQMNHLLERKELPDLKPKK